MKIFTTRTGLSDYLEKQKNTGKTIGFVPTMGALHNGHLSLIKIAADKTDLVVCSIFVNPTQFNDPKDLQNYPRPIDSDTRKLEDSLCDVLFLPDATEMYTKDEAWQIDLGYLDKILEGKIRPGHYQGVTQIVKKFFDVVKPDYAFFGQKDYQQFMVISRMVDMMELGVKMVMCPIVREADGLAMSSRNIHLSETERVQALALSKVLIKTKNDFDKYSVTELKENVINALNASNGIQLEYFEICDSKTLMSVSSKQHESLVALIAARVNHTRLIDNIILK